MGWGWNPFEEVADLVEDGLDWVEDTVNDIIDNPLDGLGSLFEDNIKGGLGLLTGGLSNKYDRGYWIDKYSPDPPNPVFKDRKLTNRDSLASREIVYGRVKKGGSVVYIETDGDNDEFLHLIVVLASHSCSSINQVYFGDAIVASKLANGANDTQTFSIATDYQGKLEINAQLGAHTAADASITNNTPANWSTDHKLLGCTYMHLKLTYDKELYRRGIPQISVIMDGNDQIYDPRDTSTGYSNNHALVSLDYLTSPDGMAVALGDVIMQSFIDGANHADDILATYSGGGSEPRYVANGVISIDRRPLDHLQELEKAAAAFIRKSQGAWRYIRADYEAPIMTLTDDDVIGGVELMPNTGKDGRLNSVKGVYISAENDWEPTNYPRISYPSYVSDDAEELETSIDYNFVTSPYQAQRLGKIAIERSRFGMTIKGVFKFKAMRALPANRIFLTLDALGLSAQPFIVLDMDPSFEGGVYLLLRQDSTSIYTDSATDRTPVTLPPALNLPDPNPVAPSGIVISEELYSTNGGRDIKARAVITWSEPAGRNQSYDVQYKPTSSGTWRNVETGIFGTEASKGDLAPDEYDFRIRPINSIGWVGDWIQPSAYTLQGKTALPPNLDAVTISDNVLSWTYSNEPLDLAGFEVRKNDGTSTDWASATKLHTGLVSASKFDVRDVFDAQATFLVKAVDRFGYYSAAAVTVTGLPTENAGTVTYRQEATPSAPNTADLWYKPSTKVLSRYSGSVWEEVGTSGATWDDVTGTGKPEDNATNGASWEENINGQPDRGMLLNNLIDVSGWIDGDSDQPAQGSTGAYGPTGVNTRIAGTGPFGTDEILWRVKPTSLANNYGGISFNTSDAQSPVIVNPNKVYRFSVWYKTNSTGGTIRVSPSTQSKLKDLATGNFVASPYPVSGAPIEANKWYLVVMLIYPAGTTRVTNSTYSGVYDPTTGERVAGCDEYKLASTTDRIRSQVHYINIPTTNDYAEFARPRVDTIDGKEVSIQQLMNTMSGERYYNLDIRNSEFQTADFTQKRTFIEKDEGIIRTAWQDGSSGTLSDWLRIGPDQNGGSSLSNSQAIDIGGLTYKGDGVKVQSDSGECFYGVSFSGYAGSFFSTERAGARVAGLAGVQALACDFSFIGDEKSTLGDTAVTINALVPKGDSAVQFKPVYVAGVLGNRAGYSYLLEVKAPTFNDDRVIGILLNRRALTLDDTEVTEMFNSSRSVSYASYSSTHDLAQVAIYGIVPAYVAGGTSSIGAGDMLRSSTANNNQLQRNASVVKENFAKALVASSTNEDLIPVMLRGP